MSSVDKLLIRGIRSFEPEEPNVIQFYSPLTLIVGSNGSGKTTIIECLKYACTGDLPPNSKGGAFVHDTKLCGKAEVKAQIKLKFRNVKGKDMTCTRSLSLTQTKTTAKLRTLESLLQTRNEDTGETYSISTRCSELDAELPLHLGVPKAILDNVIFCHQEESNWPLSEPSLLKKKFDDIFSSTKYTKALTNIKDLRKNRNENLRVDNQRFQAAASDKEKAAKVRKNVALINNQMSKKREDVTEFDEKMKHVSKEIDSLLVKVQEFQSLENRLNQKIHQMQVTGENRDELASNMTMMTQTDRELERMKEQHQSRISADEEARQAIKVEQEEMETQLKQYQHQVLAKMTELGKLEAEKTANEQRVKDRKQIILNAKQRYSSFDFNDEDITDEDVVRFEEKLTRSVQEKQATRIRLKKDASDTQEQFETDIQVVRSEKTSLEEGRKYAKKQLDINQQNINRLTDQIHGIKVSKSEMEYLNQKLESAQNELKKCKNESLLENLPEQLAKKEKELRDVDDGISAMNDEMAVLNKQSDTRAKLSLKKQDRDRLSASADGLLSECKQQVLAATDRESTLDSLERDIDNLLSTNEQELKAAQSQWSTALTDLSSIDTKLKMAVEDLEAKKTEYRDLDRQIKDVCKDERLPDLLADCESELEESKSMLSGVDGAVEMYKRFLAAARKNDSCPLCRRGFQNNAELEVLIKKLDELMIRQPQQAQGIKQEIQELEQRHTQLKSLEPSWNKLVQLRDSLLDAAKSSVTDLKEKKRWRKEESEKIQDSITSLEQGKTSIISIKHKSEEITRLKSEIRALSDGISTLEEELSLSGSTKTVDEYSSEMEQLADKGRALRRAVKALHDDRNRQTNKLQMLEGKIRDAKDELSQMQQKNQTKEDLQSQIDGLVNDNKRFEPSQSQTDDKISVLSSRIEELTQSLRTFQRKSAQEQDDLQQEINSMEQDLERLKSSTAAIKRYHQTAGPQQFEKCNQEKQALDKKVETIVQQHNDMSSKLVDMDKRLNQAKTFERDVSDNLRYRTAVASIENLQEEIRELQQQMREWDDSTYERQLAILQEQQADIINKRGGLQGELRQMQDQIERYNSDLNNEYKDIDKIYRKIYVGVKASEMAIADMSKYALALEKAIMKYHALKMDDLNKIIKELWINTYKGGDIDYIEIQSDNEGPASNRSYNYRVMMVQNGHKMQMRGRCSAGQKVLTSIIIRLALAETFCINCGILALDEPTTNLDRDNIESLANSLASIIRARRQQANFQLIVITHDEEFVDFLGRSDIAEYYYRVHKDQAQHSVIERIRTEHDSNGPLLADSGWMCSFSQSVLSGHGRVSSLGLVFGVTKACSVGPKPFFKVPIEQIIFLLSFLLFFSCPFDIMSNFDSIDVNTIQWFDGENNQHQNIPEGNTQLPNFSNSSLSPLILDMMNNPENQSRLQQRGGPQIPPLDDIDILTYLMQADNENIITTHMNPMDSSSALMPGEIVPMPTISAQPGSEPIEIKPVPDHVALSSNASDHSSPPAHSPPHHDADEVDWRPDPETLKKMSSKERRQLRNKISARNFRVRRKEYISTLEEQIKVSDDRNKELQTKNRSLHEENSKLKAEIKRLREKYGETFSPVQSESDSETVPPITPPSSSHSVTEDNSSPPYTSTVAATTASSVSPYDNSAFADMDFMDLYASADATPNTFASFISQAVMPNWDVSTVLQGKPGDGRLVLANRGYNPTALLETYPLLGPALMSIVVNHTFNMNLAAFNTGNFPYNDPLPPYQANGVVVSDAKRKTSLSPGLDELTSNELGLLWDVLNKRYQTTLDDTDNPEQEEELRNLYAIGEKIMKQRKFRAARELFWNTLWKMQRLTPEEIEQKYKECTKCLSTKAARELQKQQQQQQQTGSSSQQTRMTWFDKKQKIIAFKVRLLKSS